MPENVNFDLDRGIIVIHSYGEVRFDEVSATIVEMERLLLEKDAKCALVDVREQRTLPSTTEIYQLASKMPRGMRVAILMSEGLPTEKGMRFAETVARNAGLQWKSFTNEEEAISWLKA